MEITPVKPVTPVNAVHPVVQPATENAASSDLPKTFIVPGHTETPIVGKDSQKQTHNTEEQQDVQPSFVKEPEKVTQPRYSVKYDPRTQSSIMQQVDPETGEVRHQFPPDSILTLRAYVRILSRLEESYNFTQNA